MESKAPSGNIFQETVSENLRRIREERNLSKAQLAKEMEIGRSNITRWERDALPNLECMVRLARIFSVSLDQLVFGGRTIDEKYVKFANGVWNSNKDNIIYYTDRGMENIAGVPQEEIVGINVMGNFPKSGLAFFLPYYQTAKETLKAVYYKAVPIITPSGRQSYQSGWLIPRVKDGEFDGMICTVEDVTERKRSEEILRKERNRVKKYLDVVGVILVVIDSDQTISLINKKGCKLLGYTEKEIIGKNWFDNFLPIGIKDKAKTAFAKLMTDKIELRECREYSILTRSGREKIISWKQILLKNDKGKNVALLGSGEDITERKYVENALRESEVKYRTLFEQAIDSVVVIDTTTGEILEFNDKAHENLGYTREEFKQLKIQDFEIIESCEEVRMHMDEILRKGCDSFETKHKRKNGEILNILVDARVISIDKKSFFMTVFHNTTET